MALKYKPTTYDRYSNIDIIRYIRVRSQKKFNKIWKTD